MSLVHLLERNHTQPFTALMDSHLPDWLSRRETLKISALGHENWAY
jgi:predicted metal-dependent hydrolase